MLFTQISLRVLRGKGGNSECYSGKFDMHLVDK